MKLSSLLLLIAELSNKDLPAVLQRPEGKKWLPNSQTVLTIDLIHSLAQTQQPPYVHILRKIRAEYYGQGDDALAIDS